MSEAEREKLVKVLRERGRPGVLEPGAMRARMEELGEKFPAPPEAIVERVNAGGRPAEWVSAADSDPGRQVLWLHGGGYVQGSFATHRAMLYRIAAAARGRVLVLDYGLAPEHPFPAALDHAVAAWRWMLEQGADPARCAIGGDSAGGGLTVATLVRLRDLGLPLPAAGVCISPWVDLAQEGETITSRADEDPMVEADILEWFARTYLNGADPRDPRASPLHADLSGLPPLLIQVGTSEILLDDARRLASKARAAGVDVDAEEWDRMVHVWHLFAPMLSEGRDACARVGTWLAGRTG